MLPRPLQDVMSDAISQIATGKADVASIHVKTNLGRNVTVYLSADDAPSKEAIETALEMVQTQTVTRNLRNLT